MAPLYVVRWSIGPVPTTLLENLVWITLALYLFALWRDRRLAPGRTPFDIPIALLLVAGFIGIFVAPDHRAALGIFRAYLVEPVAIFYVAIAALASAAAIELLLAGMAVGLAAFSVVEIVTFALAVTSHHLNPGHAAAAFGINPNSVALYLEPLIGLVAGFALFGAPGQQRRIAVALFVVAIVAEVATLSRGGVFALAALVFIAILTIRDLRLRAGIAVAALAGALALWKLPFIGPRLEHIADPISGTLDSRGRIWAASIRMLREHPIFGAGVNGYQTVMAPIRATDSNLVPEPYPHNILLTSWTELGLLGLAAFAWILGGLVVLPWRRFAAASGISRPLLWGLGTAFVMVLVHGTVDSPYWKNDLSLEFWVLAALEVVTLRGVRQQSPARSRSPEELRSQG